MFEFFKKSKVAPRVGAPRVGAPTEIKTKRKYTKIDSPIIGSNKESIEHLFSKVKALGKRVSNDRQEHRMVLKYLEELILSIPGVNPKATRGIPTIRTTRGVGRPGGFSPKHSIKMASIMKALK